MWRSRARFLARALALATVAVLVGAASARGDDPGERTYDCGLLAAGITESETCAESSPAPAVPPPACRSDVEGVFWTGADWERIAKALAAERSPCADYWVSIPPLAANKKGLRVLQDDVIRSYGIHPVAEFTIGENTGWANWVLADPSRTWFQAGVEFRRAMAAAGYRGPDETWLLNELDRSTMLDAPRGSFPEDHAWPAFRRADMIQLLEGLYYGVLGMEPLPGVVEIGIHHRHQNRPDVAEYKEEAKAWLEDGAFWHRIDRTVRWLAVEAYPDVRNWGVEGTSRDERRRYTEDYVFHLLDLVRAGPESVADARALFERAYTPFMNAGYRARGGDQFLFRTGHGNTIVDADTMRHFVSEQVYAAKHYAAAHPRGAPGARLGFSWQPCNRASATEEACKPLDAAFIAALDAITARVAESIRYAFRQGEASPAGACRPPTGGANWCDGAVPGAAFVEDWRTFQTW